MKVLVLAAHPADETIGCGGTIAKMIDKGDDVYIAVFSPSNSSNLNEEDPGKTVTEFNKAMGIYTLQPDNGINLSFEENNFIQQRNQIHQTMVELKDMIQPDFVFTHAKTDYDPDHGVIHHESRKVFNDSTLFAYEVPWCAKGFMPTSFSPMEKEHLCVKVNVLKQYTYAPTHLKRFMEQETVEAFAKVYGAYGGFFLAEGFEVLYSDM